MQITFYPGNVPKSVDALRDIRNSGDFNQKEQRLIVGLINWKYPSEKGFYL
jgi:hypothetical protein